MPHATSIIPIPSIAGISFLFLFIIGFFLFIELLVFPFQKNKKLIYKTVSEIGFPILAIATILFSFFILITTYNQHIEKELYDTLNEIAHKETPSRYEQAYFDTELARLAYLDEHYTLSVTSSHSFSWTDDPKIIFNIYDINQ